jgi:hypothetical protein
MLLSQWIAAATRPWVLGPNECEASRYRHGQDPPRSQNQHFSTLSLGTLLCSDSVSPSLYR